MIIPTLRMKTWRLKEKATCRGSSKRWNNLSTFTWVGMSPSGNLCPDLPGQGLGSCHCKMPPLLTLQKWEFKEHSVCESILTTVKSERCKEFLLFKIKSLQTSPWWDSGKLWFREMLSLAKSMTLLPRSPTVIKWVNDWIKLLMVGWARWPLRSCQVSISENQEFYQSSKNVALCWIWPQTKNWKVSKMFPFCLSFHCSVLSPQFQPSCQAVITLKAILT